MAEARHLRSISSPFGFVMPRLLPSVQPSCHFFLELHTAQSLALFFVFHSSCPFFSTHVHLLCPFYHPMSTSLAYSFHAVRLSGPILPHPNLLLPML